MNKIATIRNGRNIAPPGTGAPQSGQHAAEAAIMRRTLFIVIRAAPYSCKSSMSLPVHKGYADGRRAAARSETDATDKTRELPMLAISRETASFFARYRARVNARSE